MQKKIEEQIDTIASLQGENSGLKTQLRTESSARLNALGRATNARSELEGWAQRWRATEVESRSVVHEIGQAIAVKRQLAQGVGALRIATNKHKNALSLAASLSVVCLRRTQQP